MIFAGLELMGDVPFHDVVIHSLVHAPTGGRMSKSLGTGMNPIAQIETLRRRRDPLRADEDGVVAGRDVRRGGDRGGAQAREQALERGRLIVQAGGRHGRRAAGRARGALDPRAARVGAGGGRAQLADFDFSHLVDELYHLTFDDFCDWYLEAIKPRIYAGDADALRDRGRRARAAA